MCPHGKSNEPGDWPRCTQCEVDELADLVNRAMPTEPLAWRMRIAMKACRGHLNPAMVSEALMRGRKRP